MAAPRLSALLLTLLLGVLVAPAGRAEPHPDWFKTSFLDLREDVSEAAAGHRRVLLYFYQDGCPYCAKLLRDNLGQRAIEEKMRANFEVIALNLWGDREVTDLTGAALSEKAFAESLGVQFTPTLLFLDEQGAVRLRINGYYPPHKFDAALDYAAPGTDRPASFRAYLAERAPQPAAGALHGEPFLDPPPHRLNEGGRPLIVLFEQRGCPACDELHREAFARPEVREALGAFRVVQLDLWGDTPVVTPGGESTTARAWADRLGLQYAPTLLFFDAQGREVFRNEAYLRPFHLVNTLRYVASGAYREQPSFQRYLQAQADAQRERGETVDLWR